MTALPPDTVGQIRPEVGELDTDRVVRAQCLRPVRGEFVVGVSWEDAVEHVNVIEDRRMEREGQLEPVTALERYVNEVRTGRP